MASEYHTRQVALLKRTPIKDFFSHLAYNPATYIYALEDNKIGFAFEIRPLIFAGDDVGDRLKTILNKPSMPDNSMISFAMWAGHDITHILARHKMARTERFKTTGNKDVDNTLQVLSQVQADNIAAHTTKPIERIHGSRVRDIRCFVSVVIQEEPKKAKARVKGLLDDEKYRELVTEFKEGLNSVGLAPKVLEPSILKKLLSSIINWQPNANWRDPKDGYDDTTTIKEQIVDMDTELKPITGRVFRLNDRYCSVLSAERFPKRVSLSDSYEYLMDSANNGATGIKENVLFCTNIFYHNTKKMKKSITSKRGWAASNSEGFAAKMKPVVKKIANSYETLFNSIEDNDRPCRVAFHVAVFGDSVEGVTQEAANVESRFAGLKYRMKSENQIAIPTFFGMLPLNADPDKRIVDMMGRFKTVTTKHAVRVLPISAEWKGYGRPMSLYVGRSGQILPFCNFDNSSNYNMLTMAQSGGGKSVNTNVLVADVLACGGRSIIIDQGYSYENTTEIFGGKFITFNPESCPNLNPFLFINDFENEKDMLVGLLTAMAKIKVHDQDGIYQVASLRMILDECWNAKGKRMSVDDVIQLSSQHEDQRVRDLAVLLSPFGSKGEYGKYYNDDESTAIDFDASRVIVLELDDLKDKEHLQQVVVMQLIIMTNRYVYSKHARGDKDWTMLHIDEAWKFMAKGGSEDNPVLEFILTAYRQFRKHNAAINMITQSLGDVYTTSAGAAIAENAGFKIFLGQKADAIHRLVDEKKLSMDDFWLRQLLSVETYKGHFSELFIDNNTTQGVARLILDPLILLLFSTDMEDREAIRQYKKQGFTTIDSCKRVLEQRQQRAA